jgi:hypothetical protein
VIRQVHAPVHLGRVGDDNPVADIEVGDGVTVQLRGRSLKNVVACSTGQRIRTGAALEHVVAKTAPQQIISGQAVDVIVTVSAV